MIVFNNLEEMKPYYLESINSYVINDEIKLNFDFNEPSHLRAWKIKAKNIKCWDIHTDFIKADGNIDTADINAVSICAENINAHNIIATMGLQAKHISYYAVCIAYCFLICESIESKRDKKSRFDGNFICKCLDREIEYV